MTNHQIEAFLVLGELLNFTKASQLLHTTQPNLSKIIVSLEQEIGVQLLLRNKRDVRLTPAGQAFYQDAKGILNQFDAAKTKAKNIEAGISGIIDVGFLGTALVDHLPRIVNIFKQRHPKIILNLKDYTFSPLMTALANAEIDVAFIPDRELDYIPKLEKKFLYSDDMCVVMHKDHPLSGMESVELSGFSHEPFVMMDPKVSMRDYSLVLDICQQHGFSPAVGYKANSLINLMLMVECKTGVSVLASHMKRYSTDYLKFVPIAGFSDFFKMVCAWRSNLNISVDKLVEVINRIYQS